MQILTIAGNVGKDAVLRETNGDPVLNFSLAVDNGKDKEGQSRAATWFDCSIWGKRATALSGHIVKGTKLALSGRPTCRAHDGKAYLGITVDNLTFQGGTQRSDSAEAPASASGVSGAGAGTMDDTIPFAPEVR